MIYKIASHEDEEGFGVSVPGLPGVRRLPG